MGKPMSKKRTSKKASRVVQFAWPWEPADHALYSGRYRFLVLVCKECPESWLELERPMRCAYEEMFLLLESSGTDIPAVGLGGSWDDVHSHELVTWLFGPARQDHSFEVWPFEKRLTAWQKKFRLSEDWVKDSIVRTLHAWLLGLDAPGTGRWVVQRPHDLSAPVSGSENAFTFTQTEVWQPTLETREEARERVINAFEHTLSQWFDHKEALLSQRGLKKVSVWPKRDQHLRWLVRYQCKGERWAEIARHPDRVTSAASSAQVATNEVAGAKRKLTAKAVEDAVRKAANRIGLTLRKPDPVGRPRKNNPD